MNDGSLPSSIQREDQSVTDHEEEVSESSSESSSIESNREIREEAATMSLLSAALSYPMGQMVPASGNGANGMGTDFSALPMEGPIVPSSDSFTPFNMEPMFVMARELDAVLASLPVGERNRHEDRSRSSLTHGERLDAMSTTSEANTGQIEGPFVDQSGVFRSGLIEAQAVPVPVTSGSRSRTGNSDLTGNLAERTVDDVPMAIEEAMFPVPFHGPFSLGPAPSGYGFPILGGAPPAAMALASATSCTRQEKRTAKPQRGMPSSSNNRGKQPIVTQPSEEIAQAGGCPLIGISSSCCICRRKSRSLRLSTICISRSP
jgi:hypothetical protein